MKKRSVHDRHEKYHGSSALATSFSNGMITVVGVASARNWDGAILAWSELGNIAHDSCLSNDLPARCLCTGNGFLGA